MVERISSEIFVGNEPRTIGITFDRSQLFFPASADVCRVVYVAAQSGAGLLKIQSLDNQFYIVNLDAVIALQFFEDGYEPDCIGERPLLFRCRKGFDNVFEVVTLILNLEQINDANEYGSIKAILLERADAVELLKKGYGVALDDLYESDNNYQINGFKERSFQPKDAAEYLSVKCSRVVVQFNNGACYVNHCSLEGLYKTLSHLVEGDFGVVRTIPLHYFTEDTMLFRVDKIDYVSIPVKMYHASKLVSETQNKAMAICQLIESAFP